MSNFRKTLLNTLENIQSRVENMNKKYMNSYIKVTGASDRTKELAKFVNNMNQINNLIKNGSAPNGKLGVKCFMLVPSVNGYMNEYLNIYKKLFNSDILDTKITSNGMSISKGTSMMKNYFESYDKIKMDEMQRGLNDIGKLLKDLHSNNAGFDFITKAIHKDLGKLTNNRMALRTGLFNLELKKLKKVTVTDLNDIKKALNSVADLRRVNDIPFIYNEILVGMKHIVEYATDLLKEIYNLKKGIYNKDVVPSEFDIQYVSAQAMQICILLESIVSDYEYIINVFFMDFDGLLKYSTVLSEKVISYLTSPESIKENHFLQSEGVV